MTTDDGYAAWLGSNLVPDFRELVQRHGGYAKIPVEAWAEFDRATAEWQERQRDAEKAARQDDDYDPGDDFSRSIDEAYAAIRARVAAGVSVANVLATIRSVVPDTSESELADALVWAIRRTKRKAALLERALRNTNATGRAEGAAGEENAALREPTTTEVWFS